MDNKILNKCIFGAMLLLFASCSQDEMPGDGNTLPEGVYPLEIASVTMDVSHSQQPWNAPQTRVSENTDGMSSKWDGGETIHVKLGNQETTYEVTDANGMLELTGEQLYWTKRTDNVTAWYASPETDGTINLADQRDKLAYMLQSTVENAFCDNSVTLNFSHQLAKIRVVLTGDKASEVNNVSIKGYTVCTHTDGGNVSGKNEGKIKMYSVGNNTFEANVVPGKEIAEFKVNGGEWITLSTKVKPEKGQWHEITINVKEQATDIDFSSGDVTISEDGNYRITGDLSSKNFTIKTPDGWSSQLRCTIILENTTLESIYLDETGTSGMTYTTFIIKGDVNIKKGIVTKCGGEINIKGTTGSKLVITSPDSHNPAIGNLNCQSRSVALTIEDATIEATGTGGAAVIGTSNGWPGEGNVGDITIKNSNLMLTAVSGDEMGNPAVIGTGVTDGASLACGNITIYLKDGQSKEDFLQNLKGDYNQQVGVGSNKSGGSVSCGSISWYNSDGSPAN